ALGVSVRLTEVESRSQRAELVLPVAGDSGWIDLSPDGRTLAVRMITASSVRLFDAATGEERFPCPGHQAAVTEASVSPDGQWPLSCGPDQRVLLWDLRAGQQVRELAFVRTGWDVFRAARFSPDGKWAAAQKSRYTTPQWIRLWEMPAGKEAQTLTRDGP